MVIVAIKLRRIDTFIGGLDDDFKKHSGASVVIYAQINNRTISFILQIIAGIRHLNHAPVD